MLLYRTVRNVDLGVGDAEGCFEQVTDVKQFAMAHAQADTLAHSLTKLGVRNRLMTAGVLWSLEFMPSAANTSVHEIIESHIGPLIAYDATTRTDLITRAGQYQSRALDIHIAQRARNFSMAE